ncbi:MAG: 4Fe-4S cluster-binding domain-containing protein [Firmicutes bacterium]|nr:4Fe-4S cluster-binding domain-containing protein [Bacillota bacterium]
MKYSFLIAITNNCNLNCSGCAWMCSNINEENKWFIPKKEFENNLKILKEKLPNLDAIDITGGETLIHPDFMDLMDILISFKEKTSHLVWTNGLLLDKISDEDLIKLYNNNIYF